jgi:hypothetical protein
MKNKLSKTIYNKKVERNCTLNMQLNQIINNFSQSLHQTEKESILKEEVASH